MKLPKTAGVGAHGTEREWCFQTPLTAAFMEVGCPGGSIANLGGTPTVEPTAWQRGSLRGLEKIPPCLLPLLSDIQPKLPIDQTQLEAEGGGATDVVHRAGQGAARKGFRPHHRPSCLPSHISPSASESLLHGNKPYMCFPV